MVSKMNLNEITKSQGFFSHRIRMVAAVDAQRGTGQRGGEGRTTKLNLGYQLHIETRGSGLLGQRSSWREDVFPVPGLA